jgi:low temperature requirement protein LtrA
VSAQRVSTLELFFDLVFVFTITQLTGVLAHDGLGTGLLHGGVTLGLVFWMYDGYAWLTNSVPMTTAPRRLGLLAAMATWLVLALAIPHAYDGDGVAFGVAYLVVVLIHGGMYALVQVGDWGRGIPRVATINTLVACVVIAGGVAGGTAQEVIWAVAFAGIWLSGLLAAVGRIEIGAEHFVERHGLIVIVTVGESIVAVGIGASHLPFDAELVAVAVLGVLLSACLWWTYFGGDDTLAEKAMRAATPEQRGRFALYGFGYCHLPMLLGIVAVAAGLEVGIAHPFDALERDPAVFLAGGAALFLLGDAAFRALLRIGSPTGRVVTAAVLLATIPLGTEGSALAQLALLVAVFSLSFLRTARR